MALNFTVVKGQKYYITIKPADADGNIAAFAGLPTATAVDPTEFLLGDITVNSDGTYELPATALKTGKSAIMIHGVGVTELNAEADGTVTLPLASQIILSGRVGS